MYYGWWWWWWVGIAVLILIGLWLLAIWARTRRPPGRGPGEMPPDRDSARRILDERYARGEITREQYEQMRRDLGDRDSP